MNFRPKGTVADDEGLKQMKKDAKKAKGKAKYPPLPKDGAPMPKKPPKGANDSSPNNPWVKL